MQQPCLVCGALSQASRCSAHKLPKTNPMRPSSTQRGYGYQWQKLSTMLRARQPWCELCGSRDRNLTVDHVIPQSLGGTNELGNLRVICTDCHLRYGATRKKAKA